MLGHDLDGAGAGADHRHPLAGEVDVVVPLRGMESGAVGSRRVRRCRAARNVQRAGTRDQELRDVLLPGVGEHVPAVLGVVPVRAVDVRVEPDVAAQTVLVGDALEVVQDLRLIARTVCSSRASARRRTSTGATARRRRSRDRCCRARCRRSRRPSPGSGSPRPGCCSAMPMPRPEKPVPMISARVCTGCWVLPSAACSGATVIDRGPSWERRYRILSGSQVNRLSLHSQRC